MKRQLEYDCRHDKILLLALLLGTKPLTLGYLFVIHQCGYLPVRSWCCHKKFFSFSLPCNIWTNSRWQHSGKVAMLPSFSVLHIGLLLLEWRGYYNFNGSRKKRENSKWQNLICAITTT